MVVWLSVRMWFGGERSVWMTSCLLGAWAPLGAAAFFLYIRAIADREDSVLVAWLVRALGMHCVLVWMLGFSDWMSGPPGQSPRWNSDIGAPIAMVLFVPTFAISYFALGWLKTLAHRLVQPIMRPAMPNERDGEVAPFRGLFLVNGGAPVTRTPLAPFAIAAVGFGTVLTTPTMPYWILPAAAIALAIGTIRNHRALAPSVVTLGALALMLVARHEMHDAVSIVAHGVQWPWLALIALGFYLVALEGMVRATRLRAA
jgi:hypothetical protein